MAKTKKNKGGGGTKRKGKQGNKGFKGGERTPKQPGFGGRGRDDPGEKIKVDNPFEIRMHRAKHDNLGRRGKHEKGLPGISRSKAIDKRRETLLKEYKVRNKSNLLIDNRIGEKVKNMSEEEKIIKRTVMEKRRQYKQKSIFNLPNTDDILTHKGQVLMDIDRYEDPRDESDSEDERLNEEFVSDAHFSGDFLKVKAKEPDDIDEDEGKSRKDIIAELILNSKKRKMEKAKEADENYELVTKLDDEFKTPDFRNLLNFVRKEGAESKEVTAKKEEYDKLVRELQFETKTGSASNRLKTEEEVQEEELNQLHKLEKDRIRRMQAQDPTVPNHRSADDLNDGFEIDEDIPVMSYGKNGKLNSAKNDEDENDDESSNEEDEDGDEEEKVEDEESGDSDAFSDLGSDEERDSSPKQDDSDNDLYLSAGENEAEVDRNGVSNSLPDNSDIPYTLALPKSYDTFKKLMSKYKALVKNEEKFVLRFKIVVERLVKYSLLADKSRSPELFIYLLRFLLEGINDVQCLDRNVKQIIDIAAVSLHSVLLTNSAKCVELMEEEFNQLDKSKQLRLSNLVLYQLCSKLFCVTDFCHRVLSPMKVKMLETVSNCNISSYMELLKILSLVNTLNELCRESKRYCPEVFKLLLDILDAISLSPEKLRLKRRRFEFLKLNNLHNDANEWKSEKCKNSDLKEEDDSKPTVDQIMSLLLTVFDLCNELSEMQHKAKSFNCVRHKVLMAQSAILRMKWENYNFHRALFARKLSSSSISFQGEIIDDPLPVSAIDRPKMIKLYEPLIEENFSADSRRRKLKRKGLTQEEARLTHKVKKEMKSAVREIRKDNAFIAKQQLKEQAMKDAERNRKVKELLGSLSNQEGDYRKTKRGD